MDRITKALFEEFIAENALTIPENTAFEHFAGYLVTSRHYSEEFSTGDIAVGGGGDCGIDCIAIIVNGTLVTEPEEVQDIADSSTYLDVTFLFVQAERSSSFDSSKITQLGFGVLDFFSEQPKLVQNDQIKHSAKIVKEIIDRSRLFKKGNPVCLLYYVTTGKWTEDQNLGARRDTAKADLQNLSIFREVRFECIDAEMLHRLYQASQNAVSTEITLSEKTVIPEMQGVEQAYLGLLPALEYLKLIENSQHEVLNYVFYDNVRHWQQWNAVNEEIRRTLQHRDQRLYFPLLNNGITIIARKLILTGNKFVLEDYQIANGCQTSFVLHECRDILPTNLMVPVRLIATQDENIKNLIITATNRQTQVTEEQLFALSEFPKKLEAYFHTFKGTQRLYYERRSRQYSDVEGIEKVRVINTTTLVRSFASVFLDIPHRTTRDYRALLASFGQHIFNKDHKLDPYYVSAYMHYRLEFLFRNQALPSDLKPARYHMLLAYRILADPANLPRMNSHEMEIYCFGLETSLWDDEHSRILFQKAGETVRAVAGGDLHRDNIRTESFTSNLLDELE